MYVCVFQREGEGGLKIKLGAHVTAALDLSARYHLSSGLQVVEGTITHYHCITTITYVAMTYGILQHLRNSNHSR